jgi:hypothetical protein
MATKETATIPTIQIVDVATGETIERDMTSDELAELALIQAQEQEWQAEQVTKAAARESALAKLADLGLTAEEIAAL